VAELIKKNSIQVLAVTATISLPMRVVLLSLFKVMIFMTLRTPEELKASGGCSWLTSGRADKADTHPTTAGHCNLSHSVASCLLYLVSWFSGRRVE